MSASLMVYYSSTSTQIVGHRVCCMAISSLPPLQFQTLDYFVFFVCSLRWKKKQRTPRIRMNKRNRKKNQRLQLTYRKSAIFSLCFMTWLTLIQFIFFQFQRNCLQKMMISLYLSYYLLNLFLNYLIFATSAFYCADCVMTMVSLTRRAILKLDWKWKFSKIHLWISFWFCYE